MRADGMPVGTPFAKGTSGKVLHRRRVTAKVAELVESFGGADKLSALDLVYIEKAAVLLTRRARIAEDEVRALNTARGLIASVERRRGRHEAPNDEFGRILDGGRP
jgi:hypothetical protein